MNKYINKDGEECFDFQGKEFSIIEHSDHATSNLKACDDRGSYLFHESNGEIKFYAVIEIYGSRSEPHITF